MRLKKIFLVTLLASLAAGAAFGVIGIYSPWQRSWPMVGTMLSVGLFSLTLLGTAILIDLRRWRLAMWVSVAASTVGLILFLSEIWLDDYIDYPAEDRLVRSMWNVATLAIALPLGGLLALTRFAHPALSLVRITIIAFVFITAGVICAMTWSNPDQDALRFLAVLLILTILGVIGLPLLHKLAGLPPPRETMAMDVSIALTCPRCGTQQSLPAGQSRCVQCKLRIAIEVEEPRCPKCSYLLYKLTEPRCPECGQVLAADDVLIAQVDPSATQPAAQ